MTKSQEEKVKLVLSKALGEIGEILQGAWDVYEVQELVEEEISQKQMEIFATVPVDEDVVAHASQGGLRHVWALAHNPSWSAAARERATDEKLNKLKRQRDIILAARAGIGELSSKALGQEWQKAKKGDTAAAITCAMGARTDEERREYLGKIALLKGGARPDRRADILGGAISTWEEGLVAPMGPECVREILSLMDNIHLTCSAVLGNLLEAARRENVDAMGVIEKIEGDGVLHSMLTRTMEKGELPYGNPETRKLFMDMAKSDEEWLDASDWTRMELDGPLVLGLIFQVLRNEDKALLLKKSEGEMRTWMVAALGRQGQGGRSGLGDRRMGQ